MALTNKQKQFADEYCKSLNATAAYKKIYQCSDKVANMAGSRLIVNDSISKYIKDRLKRVSDNQEIKTEYILKNIKEIADKKTSSDRDKLKALELLGKHLSMFTDKFDNKNTGELIVVSRDEEYKNI